MLSIFKKYCGIHYVYFNKNKIVSVLFVAYCIEVGSIKLKTYNLIVYKT